MKDAFDDLDSLKLSPETAERLTKAKPRLEAKAKRKAKLFAMLPIERSKNWRQRPVNPC